MIKKDGLQAAAEERQRQSKELEISALTLPQKPTKTANTTQVGLYYRHTYMGLSICKHAYILCNVNLRNCAKSNKRHVRVEGEGLV